MRHKPIALAVGGCLVVALTLHPRGSVVFSIAGRLLFGWGSFLWRVLPQVTVSWDGVATASACLVLFALGLHAFLRWFHREVRRQICPADPQAAPWPVRRTVSLIVGVLVSFVAGIAATGIVHQAGWLLTAKDAWTVVRRAVRVEESPKTSQQQLGIIGMHIFNYAYTRNQLPSTQYDDRQTNAVQSWQTTLLPTMPIGALTTAHIDHDQPWNAPRNAAFFRGIVPDYLNPEITPIRSPEGYGLSHYAGNRHVLGSRHPLRIREPSQGLANLILVGEVAQGFKPWGDPNNLRDPIRGTKGGNDGFGNPSQTGANFLFGDGSVRLLRKSTSPNVLARFSVPDHDTGNDAPKIAP